MTNKDKSDLIFFKSLCWQKLRTKQQKLDKNCTQIPLNLLNAFVDSLVGARKTSLTSFMSCQFISQSRCCITLASFHGFRNKFNISLILVIKTFRKNYLVCRIINNSLDVFSGLGKIHSQLAKYPPVLHEKTSNKIYVSSVYQCYSDYDGYLFSYISYLPSIH